jgi:putative Holliday junction resolvase
MTGNAPGRILAVDPGEKRLGLAISDPSQTIATPLTVIQHQSRAADAERILNTAKEHGAVVIIVGHSVDDEGNETRQGEKCVRLAEQIRKEGEIPVTLWDEYGSTQAAQAARRKMGVTRRKRSGHLDDLAAAVILQNFLDAGQTEAER